MLINKQIQRYLLLSSIGGGLLAIKDFLVFNIGTSFISSGPGICGSILILVWFPVSIAVIVVGVKVRRFIYTISPCIYLVSLFFSLIFEHPEPPGEPGYYINQPGPLIMGVFFTCYAATSAYLLARIQKTDA